MAEQKKKLNGLQELGPENERKRQRELQKLVEEMAEHTAKKCCGKLSKHLKKQLKKMNNRLDKLEETPACSPDPDRDEDGFYRLRRR